VSDLHSSLAPAPWHSSPSGSPPPPPNDRFTVTFIACRRKIQIQVLLNADAPYLPPDFIFSKGEEFALNASLSTFRFSRSWSTKNPKALAEAVTEIVAAYKDLNRRSVLQYPSERIQFECSTIQEMPGVEFLLAKTAHQEPEICLMIPLAVSDIKKFTKDACVANLYVTFRPDSVVKRTPDTSIELSEAAESLLGVPTLPSWTSETCLMEFIPAVQEAMKEQILDFAVRKSFVEHLILMLGSPLEFDSQGFRRIAFFTDDKVCAMITSIVFAKQFPREKPIVTVQATVLSQRDNKLISRSLPGVPYNPKWNADEFCKKFKEYMASIRPDFQRVILDETEL